MNFKDANRMALDIQSRLSPACEDGYCVIAGSLRRMRNDVHDIELVVRARPGRPRPTFGDLMTHENELHKILYEMEQEGRIAKVKGKSKYRQYKIATSKYGISVLNPFHLELYINTPPAQWGVQMVIRTGPGKPSDNFSKWCVTNRSNRFGGGLPDGYKVRHLAVWHVDQLDAKGEPLHGQKPLEMPTENDFLSFVGLDWIEPSQRHAPRR